MSVTLIVIFVEISYNLIYLLLSSLDWLNFEFLYAILVQRSLNKQLKKPRKVFQIKGIVWALKMQGGRDRVNI